MPQLLLAGIILVFGGAVQGAIGFGYGLIGVPLLISAGFSLSQSVALITLSIGIQVLFASYQLRDHIPWSDIKLAAFIRYLTVPLGVFILLSFEDLDPDRVKQVVGIALIIALAIRILAQQRPLQHIPLGVSVVTFSISGILQGISAMGGPPLILWMTAKDFTAKQARAFTLTVFLLNTPIQVLLLWWLSESMNIHVILLALAFAPLIVLGSNIGMRIGNQFSKPLLNRLAIGVLFLIALNAIL